MKKKSRQEIERKESDLLTFSVSVDALIDLLTGLVLSVFGIVAVWGLVAEWWRRSES